MKAKKVEIDSLPPDKYHWEIAIIPNINIGQTYNRYYLYVSWLLWNRSEEAHV